MGRAVGSAMAWADMAVPARGMAGLVSSVGLLTLH